jgi:hypothetical protein
VPPLAVLLVYYAHLLFGIDVVLNKIASISQLNASFANAAIKIICVWLVHIFKINTLNLYSIFQLMSSFRSMICPEDFERSRGDYAAAATVTP